MIKHYLFFTRNTLPQPRADLIQIISCANAAANLGYSAVLSYLDQPKRFNPARYLRPFQPQPPDLALKQFYNLQDRLQVAALPIPALATRSQNKWTHPSTIVSKYYFPLSMRPVTQLVHTRDWNFVKAAIQGGVAAIYEHDHYAEHRFEPEIVNHPLFQMTVTVAEPIRQSLLEHGMPAEKIVQIHNGFNQHFLVRHPEQARTWRDRLLTGSERLAVYSGALYPFKGVDLLLEVAANLPEVQFAFAGGKPEQVAAYQQICRDRLLSNVTFLGHLPHEQLASLLQAADVLVHPHCSGEAATFTSPMKFFDYMAAGTPIVATEIPPLMEFKPSGVVAGWCEPDQALQLEACIRQVLQTHPRRAEGYSKSMQFVHQFSWESRIATLLNRVNDTLKPQLV